MNSEDDNQGGGSARRKGRQKVGKKRKGAWLL